MEISERPDPDAILSAIRLEEKKSNIGKLKIFLGMSAGVGKTYAMLKAAHKQRAEGRDVVVGNIETHGRSDTEELLKGLPIIPTKWIEYRETVFEELDLETILIRKPQLVLVDELAHSNVPGSRHPKRWQDVLELLDSNIDVYTTVNVQHIESRKDLVESVTGISMRETVPDLVLDRASEVELIDITPSDLLQRLREGKVYLGNQSQLAAQNFFKEDKLTALREVALRLTAEKVDHDLDTMLTAQSWKPTERLMVAIDHHSDSQFLIRSARRLASNLNASWLALHVDKGVLLEPQEQISLARNLDLARQLGGEAITTQDTSLAAALKRVAAQKKITQMIIGRPTSREWLPLRIKQHSIDQLIEECGDIDIHIIRHAVSEKTSSYKWRLPFLKELSPYVYTALAFLLLSFGAKFFFPAIEPTTMGFLFLLAILLISPFSEGGPILFAAILSSILWYLLFLFPLGEMNAPLFPELVFFLLYFLIAIILGTFISRIKESEKMMRIREENTESLYEITKEIASGSSTESILEKVTLKLGKILHGTAELIIKSSSGTLIGTAPQGMMKDEKEYSVALWAFEKGKSAGWSTDTLPSVKNLYIPLKGFQETIGVLAFHPEKNIPLSFEETNLLHTVCRQLAAYLERSFTEEKTRKHEYLQQSSRVQRTIIDSIASELLVYLEMTRSAILLFKESSPPHTYNQQGHQALHKIDDSTKSMQRVLENIVAMNDLNLGVLALQKSEHSVAELVQLSLKSFENPLFTDKIEVDIPSNLSLATFDLPLMQLLLSHLLEMFLSYSFKGFTIRIEGSEADRKLRLAIKTLPSTEKKVSITNEEISLGCSVAKAIAEIHGGKLEMRQPADGGLEFIIFLPLATSLIGRISKLSQKKESSPVKNS